MKYKCLPDMLVQLLYFIQYFYHYVASKEELLDAMINVVFEEIELPPEETDWQSAMRRRSVSARQVLARHPWAIGLMESRTSPGPAHLRHREAVTACLRRAGFPVLMATHANWLLDVYVYGFALQEASLPFDTADEFADMAEDVFLPQLPPRRVPLPQRVRRGARRCRLRPGRGVHLRPRPRPSRPRAPESLRIATLTDRHAALCTAASIHNLTAKPRLLSPEDNNERQTIHDHESGKLR